MAPAAIEIENLSKEYPCGFLHLKRKKSLEDLTMRVEDGEVFGFLGPNGAGKSTTIKLLSPCMVRSVTCPSSPIFTTT
jgi:ABC-2 type transport system ATP-binding protein